MTSFYVDSSVATSGDGRSWASAWKSFANINWSAMSSAVAPTLYISGGTYYERLYPQAGGQAGNTMTITVGANAPDPVGHDGPVIIDGQGTQVVGILLESQASYLNILGRDASGAYKLEIRNMAPNTGGLIPNKCVRAYNGNHLTIDGIKCPNVTQVAFAFDHENYGVIRNCYADSLAGYHEYIFGGVYVQYCTGFTVENNVSIMRSTMDYDTLGNYCDCMQIFDATDLTFRNNLLVWEPNTGNRNCGTLMVDAVRGNSIFYNNVMVGCEFNPSEMFQFETNGVGQLNILNNTCIATCTTGSKIIHFNNAGGDANIGAIKNNIFYSPAGYCMVLEPWINPAKIDNNLCCTGGAYVSYNQSQPRTWAQHKAAGYDVHGINADPLLDSEYHPRYLSPCIGAGADYSSLFSTDKDGNPRQAGAWEIGAYEYGGPMGLVERLMHEPGETVDRYISVHEFFASVTELIYGKLTASQIQNHYAMTTEDLVDWNALAAQIPAANQTAARAMWAEHLHAAFILAERRIPTYSTPAEVRARLGI